VALASVILDTVAYRCVKAKAAEALLVLKEDVMKGFLSAGRGSMACLSAVCSYLETLLEWYGFPPSLLLFFCRDFVAELLFGIAG
jgi:hypothetical protein